MRCFTLCLLYGAFAISSSKCDDESYLELSMKKAGIVPDIIPDAPKYILHVNYLNGVRVEHGNELTPTQVKDVPLVSWNHDPKAFYTLVMIDPDVPSRSEPTIREMNHGLLVNIPGGNVQKGKHLVEYLTPCPSQTSGLHRYILLIYKQPSELEFKDDNYFINNSTYEGRANFSTNAFALKYNLGSPVYGNFFLSQYDDYVPILQKQLGIQVKTSNNSSKVVAAMEIHEVVPDLIPVAPSDKLDVIYPSGAIVNLGNELTPTQVKDVPSLDWPVESNAFYTVCMTDPDSPSRVENSYKEWHLWLVGNIPGKDISKGEILSDYIGSGPPPDTGLHRVALLVYKQPSKLNFDEPRLTNRSPDKRDGFSIAKFAVKYNLGNPVAGNFYLAQYDDYVPFLYEQIGLKYNL